MRVFSSATTVAAALALAGCYAGGGGGQASDGSTGGSTGADETGESSGAGAELDPCVDAPTELNAAPVRLLTRFEYDNTIRDLLFDSTRPAKAFPAENKAGGFENNAAVHIANPLLVRQYMEISEELAARAVASKLGKLLPCDPVAVGEQVCGQQFVAHFAQRAFRRAPDATELAIFTGLFDATYPTEGFNGALAVVIEAVLQSPQFLYRVELPRGGGEQDGEVVAVTGFEMAARLSYFLHATMPDDTLLTAAASGELDTPEDIEAHARRMLASPKARDTLRSFHRQWLGLDALPSMAKDLVAFPGFDPSYLRDWQDSVLGFVEYVFFNTGSLEEMMSSPSVFLTDNLAAWYGYLPAGSGEGQTIQKYEFPTERWGLLTQPGMMALLAYADQGSPIARGVFVRKQMLCQELPPPPPDVMVTPPSPDPNATTRERFRQHTDDPLCGGCHQLIDPLGFGFENYDGIGRFRDVENGLAIDASGEVLGANDDDLNGAFAGPGELATRLADSTDLGRCVTKKWLTYALGRDPLLFTDECTMHNAQKTLETTGDLRELVIAVVMSDAFLYRAPKLGGGL